MHPFDRVLVWLCRCRTLRTAVGGIAFLSVPVQVSRAQAGVTLMVQSSANLRASPSTAGSIIRSLSAGDSLALLTAHTSHDYLYVVAGTDTGWIFSRLVELSGSADVAAAVAPDSVPAPSGTGIVSDAPASYHNCPLDGNPKPTGPNVVALRALNQAKNRFHTPSDTDIDPQFTLANLLQPGADDHRFDMAKGGELEGIVIDVKVGGIETVNCGTHDPLYRDTHVEIATRANALSTERVIVEVTPRWRDAMQRVGMDWTTDGLKSLIGKRVRFRGWELFDAEHRQQAENTAPGHAGNWRATVWELHPVTSFEILTP